MIARDIGGGVIRPGSVVVAVLLNGSGYCHAVAVHDLAPLVLEWRQNDAGVGDGVTVVGLGRTVSNSVLLHDLDADELDRHDREDRGKYYGNSYQGPRKLGHVWQGKVRREEQ